MTGQEVWSSCPAFLHHLHYEAAHGLCCLVLHLPGGVSVCAEGEARVVVAQHTGDRFDVHAVLQGQSRKGVSEICQCQARTKNFLKFL